jgi:UDP-glucose 4-epimerase
MEKILLTGSNGFVGSFLKKNLLKNNRYSIIGVDCNKNNFKHKNYTFYKLDLQSNDLLKKLSNHKIDYIIHLAAISTDRVFKEDLNNSFKNNINSTLNLLNLAEKKKIRNFIFASSEWVYGDNNKKKILNENFIINRAKLKSSYGLSKLICEDLIINSYNLQKINKYNILRFGIIYGPREKPGSVVEGLLKESLEGVVKINGSLATARKFIYIDDLVSGIVKSIKNKNTATFNLTNNKLNSLKDILSVIKTNIRPNLIIKNINNSSPVIRNTTNAFIKKKLLWNPKISLSKGIKYIYKTIYKKS